MPWDKQIMPARHSIDKELQLIITTWEGEARDIEFIEALKKYQEDIQNQPENMAYNEIVDLSNMTNIKLTTEGIISISQIAAKSDRGDTIRKLALIVGSNLAYGLARMYETYRSLTNKSSKVVRVFKDKEAAYEWVKKKPNGTHS